MRFQVMKNTEYIQECKTLALPQDEEGAARGKKEKRRGMKGINYIYHKHELKSVTKSSINDVNSTHYLQLNAHQVGKIQQSLQMIIISPKKKK